MSAREKPQTLYKFRSWSDKNHRKLLTESKLWVPVATGLNDPFDCCIPFRLDLMSEEDFLERVVLNPPAGIEGSSIAEVSEWAKPRIDEFLRRDPAQKEEVLLRLARSYSAFHGVLSFATIRDDPLLWPHYANCYEGFCVGFDYDRFNDFLDSFLDITGIPSPGRWIDYVEEMPVIAPTNNDGVDSDAYLRLLTVKSIRWEYEKEYRYVFSNWHDRELVFDASFVTEIILGSECSIEDRAAIRTFAQKRFPSATVFQAKKKPFAFELEFVPLD